MGAIPAIRIGSEVMDCRLFWKNIENYDLLRNGPEEGVYLVKIVFYLVYG